MHRPGRDGKEMCARLERQSVFEQCTGEWGPPLISTDPVSARCHCQSSVPAPSTLNNPDARSLGRISSQYILFSLATRLRTCHLPDRGLGVGGGAPSTDGVKWLAARLAYRNRLSSWVDAGGRILPR